MHQPIKVDLVEWQESSPDTNPFLRDEFLDDDGSRDLAKLLSDRGMVEIDELRTGLYVRATSFVGRVQLGRIRITIRPKLAAPTLVRLLHYAYELRDVGRYPAVEYVTNPKATLHDILIAQLVAETDNLLRRGLHRRYVSRAEELASPRGKIDVQSIARTGTVDRTTIPCTYYPRLEDHLLNQVLAGGLTYAAGLTDDVVLRSTVRRVARQLRESVSGIALSRDIFRQLWRVRNRMTTVYDSALRLIELLYAGHGITLDEPEGVMLPGILIDMNRVFQALLSRFLRDHLEGDALQDEKRLTGIFDYVSGYNPGKFQSPTPRPDFVVTREGRTIAILDAKYMDLQTRSPSRDVIYQLAIYALSRDRNADRTATILYPAISANAQEARLDIRDPFRQERKAQIIIRPVDLERLDQLVNFEDSAAMRRYRAGYARWLAFGHGPTDARTS